MQIPWYDAQHNSLCIRQKCTKLTAVRSLQSDYSQSSLILFERFHELSSEHNLYIIRNLPVEVCRSLLRIHLSDADPAFYYDSAAESEASGAAVILISVSLVTRLALASHCSNEIESKNMWISDDMMAARTS